MSLLKSHNDYEYKTISGFETLVAIFEYKFFHSYHTIFMGLLSTVECR